MATQFDVTQKLVGVHTVVDAIITDTKTGGTFKGSIDFNWEHRTVSDVLTFASKDRRIAIAPMVRTNIMKYRNNAKINVVVAAPGHRDTPARVITVDDLVSVMAKMTDADITVMVERARSNRNTA